MVIETTTAPVRRHKKVRTEAAIIVEVAVRFCLRTPRDGAVESTPGEQIDDLYACLVSSCP